MKIAIGADHGGFELKQTLTAKLSAMGHEVIDMGTDSATSVDYPDFADQVCGQILDGRAQFGVLVCGTGIGMSMAANKYRGIRAALCDNEYSARMSREHNNANILCLGDRVLGKGLAENIVEVWLSASFDGGRHQRRVDKFSD
ncbi:MAG: ribose 5-phosphate isomerase B [Desulfofustis sp.]|nr:ribose 5-phosphate isomerase B [Desulfofustis sp.]NNK56264.1 ribose 5-phosphate isomerase B [Desulfofustis sp.]